MVCATVVVMHATDALHGETVEDGRYGPGGPYHAVGLTMVVRRRLGVLPCAGEGAKMAGTGRQVRTTWVIAPEPSQKA